MRSINGSLGYVPYMKLARAVGSPAKNRSLKHLAAAKSAAGHVPRQVEQLHALAGRRRVGGRHRSMSATKRRLEVSSDGSAMKLLDPSSCMTSTMRG